MLAEPPGGYWWLMCKLSILPDFAGNFCTTQKIGFMEVFHESLSSPIRSMIAPHANLNRALTNISV
jgi:hypothetical protein